MKKKIINQQFKSTLKIIVFTISIYVHIYQSLIKNYLIFLFLFHLSISHESLLIIPFNKQSINEIYKIESVCSQINTN